MMMMMMMMMMMNDDDDTMHRQFQTRRQSSFIKLYLIVN